MQTTTAEQQPEVPAWGQLVIPAVQQQTDRDRLRTVREIADLAQVSRNVVLAAIHAGELVASRPARHWRIRLADYERWIDSTRTTAGTTTTEPAPGGAANVTPEAGREDAS